MSLTDKLTKRYRTSHSDTIALNEYLELAKKDPKVYASPFERMLDAIGAPELVDTSKDPRLSRIYSNRILRVYPAFKDFYGIEETVERIVDFFKHASQNLEESKQILYLLGGVGGAKSTLAKTLKHLMEKVPFYAIEGSPLNDSPLCLFNPSEDGEILQQEYGIPAHRLIYTPSPWLIKRLKEHNGDTDWIKIVKLYPSSSQQIAVARTEPGDENNQDISALVGKIDIRKLEKFAPNDPDSYNYSGGLCLANRGILEFVEMFKAPIKVLHPLLSATQDRQYNGSEPGLSAMPFEGIIIAHSNEAEWESFRNDKKNEAFIDRVFLVKVPYCLRINEEIEIYKKLIKESNLVLSPCTPKTLDLLAVFSVLSRIESSETDSHLKARIYNGENVKDKINNPKSLQFLKEEASVTEGMSGLSPRFAFKVLSKTFNYDPEEVGANPVHLLQVLTNSIHYEQFTVDKTSKLQNHIKSVLIPLFNEYLFKEIQIAYLESYSEYGQNQFDRYITYAESWIEDLEYRDPNTGLVIDRLSLDKELLAIEQPAGITNAHDFRHEVVTFCNRARVKLKGKNPRWTDYEKLRLVIEKKLFKTVDEILPVISFDSKKEQDDEKKHKSFVKRMIENGYTEKQVRLVVEYYLRNRNSEK